MNPTGNPKFVLVGRKSRHLEIPDGYTLVKEGLVQSGDLWANLMTAKWSIAESDDIGLDVLNFDYIIRKNPE